jgi:hypothetical protein
MPTKLRHDIHTVLDISFLSGTQTIEARIQAKSRLRPFLLPHFKVLPKQLMSGPSRASAPPISFPIRRAKLNYLIECTINFSDRLGRMGQATAFISLAPLYRKNPLDQGISNELGEIKSDR